MAEEFVLGNGFLENRVIIKAAAHLDQRFGYGYCAGIRLRRIRRSVVDVAISVDHPLVVAAAALSGRTSVQRLAHAIRGGIAVSGPAFRMPVPRAGVRRHEWDGH